jgi:hypothetical protein
MLNDDSFCPIIMPYCSAYYLGHIMEQDWNIKYQYYMHNIQFTLYLLHMYFYYLANMGCEVPVPSVALRDRP